MATFFYANALTGGAPGALDDIDGDKLTDQDIAFATVSGVLYTYWLDDDSGATESVPTVITPDAGAGTKRWLLHSMSLGDPVEIYGDPAYLKLINTSASNGAGFRNSRIRFKGYKADLTEHVLGQIEFSHFGSSDDEKGQMIVYMNDGNDGTGPSLFPFAITGLNVGVGITIPTEVLHVYSATDATVFIDGGGGTAEAATLRFKADRPADGGAAGDIQFYNDAGLFARIKAIRGSADDKGDLYFETQSVERLRIDEDGDVSIGITAAAGRLHTAKGNASNQFYIDTFDDGASYSTLILRKSDSDTVGTAAETDDGDILGMFEIYCVDSGGSFDNGARILARQDGASGTRVPTKLEFTTWNSTGQNNAMILDAKGNLIVNHATPNGNLSGGLIIANGTSASAAVVDGIQIYAKDSSDGAANSTLALYTEQGVEAIGTFTASHKLKVWVNGTEYWLQLDAV